MNIFNKSKILENNDIIAEQLKEARESLNLDLEEIAKRIKINIKYLKALENGEFEKLPKGIYGKNFLQEYAFFLNLDVNYLVDLYNDDIEIKNGSMNFFVAKANRISRLIVVSKIFRLFLLLLFVFCFLGYLSFYVNKIIAAPELEIYNLENNKIVYNKSINIVGKTEKETSININNETVLVDADGYFSKELILKQGLNVITVLAKKKHGKKNEINRNIILN